MSQMFTWLTGLFTAPSYQGSVEQYIASKHPTSAAEVEHWIRQYDTRKEWSL